MSDFFLVLAYVVILAAIYVGYRIYTDKRQTPPEFTTRDVIQFLVSGRWTWPELWQAIKPAVISFVTLVCAVAAGTAVKLWLRGK